MYEFLMSQKKALEKAIEQCDDLIANEKDEDNLISFSKQYLLKELNRVKKLTHSKED